MGIKRFKKEKRRRRPSRLHQVEKAVDPNLLGSLEIETGMTVGQVFFYLSFKKA